MADGRARRGRIVIVVAAAIAVAIVSRCAASSPWGEPPDRQRYAVTTRDGRPHLVVQVCGDRPDRLLVFSTPGGRIPSAVDPIELERQGRLVADSALTDADRDGARFVFDLGAAPPDGDGFVVATELRSDGLLTSGASSSRSRLPDLPWPADPRGILLGETDDSVVDISRPSDWCS